MANAIYNSFKADIGDGTLDWDTDTFKIALVTSTYSPDIDTHNNFTTHVTNEVVGTGYTAGGATLTTSAPTVDTTNDWAEYDATDVTWSASSITARGAVIYKNTTEELVCYIDFGSDKTSSSGDFTVQFHADGVFKLA